MSLHETIPAIFLLDGYKLFHASAYDKNTTQIYSNFTNRNGKFSKSGLGFTVWVGAQNMVQDYLMDDWGRFFRTDRAFIEQEFKRVYMAYMFVPAPQEDVDRMLALHDLGYLPIVVKSLPEGSLVPYKVPCLTIENTHPDFAWVTNSLESHMSSCLWPISTAASIAYAYRKRFEREPSIPHDLIKYMGHDFSYRGDMGLDGAVMVDLGHLTSFSGTDCVPGAYNVERNYGDNWLETHFATSVRATEHSVETSNIFIEISKMIASGEITEDQADTDEVKLEAEKRFLKRLLTEVAPNGILSYVADGLDFWGVVTKVLPALKDTIMARDGQLVVRPDSGDPVEIICGSTSGTVRFENANTLEEFKEYAMDYVDELFREELDSDPCNPICYWDELCEFDGKIYNFHYEPDLNRYDKTYYYVDNYGSMESNFTITEVEKTVEGNGLVECLWDLFGGTITEDGLKMLDPHIGAIYGDSITLERQDQIITRLKAKGFVPTVVLGIGSFTYQYNTRDSEGSAVKATNAMMADGSQVAIYKDPKTDPGKKSAKGLFKVVKENGTFVLHDNVTREEEQSEDNALQVIFKDGVTYNHTTLAEIRRKLWGDNF